MDNAGSYIHHKFRVGIISLSFGKIILPRARLNYGNRSAPHTLPESYCY